MDFYNLIPGSQAANDLKEHNHYVLSTGAPNVIMYNVYSYTKINGRQESDFTCNPQPPTERVFLGYSRLKHEYNFQQLVL